MALPDFEIPIAQIPQYLYLQITNIMHSFSTGLIKITKQSHIQEKAILIGSGTFVSLNGTHGILTAHHVVEQLNLGCALGLILVSSEHRIAIDFQYLRIINIGRGLIEAEGPDLSFIALPTTIVSTIKIYKQFYNLSTDREKMLSTPTNFHSGLWFICGIHDERSREENSKQGFDKIISIEGICGVVGVEREFKSGDYDYFEADIEYSKGLDVPKTFGGFSGGGLWQVPIMKSPNGTLSPINYYLSGVIYYQSEIQGNKRFIRCHGRQSIYKNVHNKVNTLFSLK